MLTHNLFEEILVAPVRQKANTLYAVSGYASATMAYKHVQRLKRFNKDVRIELIVGMVMQDGISKKDHEGFQGLIKGPCKDLFTCRYVVHGSPVHTKTYMWYSDDTPKVAFTGSANYTQTAFGPSRREAMIRHDPVYARDYFDLVRQDTIECSDPQVEQKILIHSEPGYSIRVAEDREGPKSDEDATEIANDLEKRPHQRVSLLANNGSLPQRSGLNWGQRPEAKREPNQAYIRLPVQLAKADFFPPRGEQFTIITDDDKWLICTRAQDYGKAIHTSDSNSRMGTYFRYRLGLPEGSLVRKEDLARHGRTDIDFYKIDEETYFMDFSV